ncbi:DUF5958 family protein, partial [Streptomyces albogriseolus]
MSQGIEWFDSLGQEEQSEVLLFLRHHCAQAPAVAEDAPESIRRAGLRPSVTPIPFPAPRARRAGRCPAGPASPGCWRSIRPV